MRKVRGAGKESYRDLRDKESDKEKKDREKMRVQGGEVKRDVVGS